MKMLFFRVIAILVMGWAVGLLAQNPDSPTVKHYEYLTKQADIGDAKAQYDLGMLYANGDGDNWPKDEVKAVFLIRSAAVQGLLIAQLKLAEQYESGQGITVDHSLAFVWWIKAAEQGNSYAQNKLGVKYANGQNIQQDYTQAVIWFSKAAEQGNASAQYNLGQSYRDGKGLPQDSIQAAFWYRKAADQEYVDACYNLAVLYYNGEGVPQDFSESYFWYDIAAALQMNTEKKQDAAKTRDEVSSKLTSTVLLQTQERARKWVENHHTN